MKKYISIIVLLSLFVIGCSEQSSINSPVNNVSSGEPNWIALPKAEGFSIEQSFSASKSISGSVGGTIYLKKNYTTTTGNIVTIDAKASFPAGAFSGTKTLTMTVDDQACTVQLSPSMVFGKPVLCEVTYTGINLGGVNPSTVKFAYVAYDGSVQYAANAGITADPSTGTLKVVGGIITINSRYGFVN